MGGDTPEHRGASRCGGRGRSATRRLTRSGRADQRVGWASGLRTDDGEAFTCSMPMRSRSRPSVVDYPIGRVRVRACVRARSRTHRPIELARAGCAVAPYVWAIMHDDAGGRVPAETGNASEPVVVGAATTSGDPPVSPKTRTRPKLKCDQTGGPAGMCPTAKRTRRSPWAPAGRRSRPRFARWRIGHARRERFARSGPRRSARRRTNNSRMRSCPRASAARERAHKLGPGQPPSNVRKRGRPD